MAARPLVAVQGTNASISLPDVLLAPIRNDIVQFVHTNMNKNRRQAYSVNKDAGMQHSAHSWGTGRAVSRIPRVSGGGTSRAGQAAFGNMCRKGRMFAPTKTWRRWHRKININQRRYAVASALAATALPSLVLARGHKISNVPEIPLVLDSSVEALQKTKQAIAALQKVGAYDDVLKSKASRKVRAGKGKMRGRRHVQRRGPLIVYANDNGIVQSFRNLPGVDTCCVTRLNLLQLAPGGHLGRLVVWTQPAFEQLNAVFGTKKAESKQKKGYKLPQNILANPDITRVINSEEIQSIVNPVNKDGNRRRRLKKNPLKNLGALVKLNPYALTIRRKELLFQNAKAAGKVKKTPRSKNHKRAASLTTYGRISAQDDAADIEAARLKKEAEDTAAAAAAAEAAARSAADAKVDEPAKPAPSKAKPAANDDDEEDAPFAGGDDDEEDAPAPKKPAPVKAAPKKPAADDDEDDAPAPVAKKASGGGY